MDLCSQHSSYKLLLKFVHIFLGFYSIIFYIYIVNKITLLLY